MKEGIYSIYPTECWGYGGGGRGGKNFSFFFVGPVLECSKSKIERQILPNIHFQKLEYVQKVKLLYVLDNLKIISYQ